MASISLTLPALNAAWSQVTDTTVTMVENHIRELAQALQTRLDLQAGQQAQIIQYLSDASSALAQAPEQSPSGVAHAGRVLLKSDHLQPAQQLALCEILKDNAVLHPEVTAGTVAHAFRDIIKDEAVRQELLIIASLSLQSPITISDTVLGDLDETFETYALTDKERTQWENIERAYQTKNVVPRFQPQ